MLRLERGSTGFYDPSAPPTALTDLDSFRSACQAGARLTSAHLMGLRYPGPTPNFYVGLLRYPERELAVVGHELLPLLAIARPPAEVDAGPLRFAEAPELAKALARSSPFRVLGIDELATSLGDVDLSLLADDERQQIRYWKPPTIGELLFNYWD